MDVRINRFKKINYQKQKKKIHLINTFNFPQYTPT